MMKRLKIFTLRPPGNYFAVTCALKAVTVTPERKQGRKSLKQPTVAAFLFSSPKLLRSFNGDEIKREIC